MKIFLRILILFGTIILPEVAWTQGDCSSCTIYRGYISSDMQMWKREMAGLREACRTDPVACTQFTLTEAMYGYIGFLISVNDKNAARPLVDTFEMEIEQLAAYSEYRAETEAFRLALLGYRMALNPARSVTLGPKALRQLEKAMEIGSSCPSVWIEKANSESNMPAFAGGSEEKAAASFREALRLFEEDGKMSECNWRYLNTIVLLGQLLEEMGDYIGARDEYMRALTREPDFRRVRNEMLPQVERKIK